MSARPARRVVTGAEVAGTAAGYSGKSLADKLGIKPGIRIWALHPPPHYQALLGPLPAEAAMVSDAAHADLLHAFVVSRDNLERYAKFLTDAPRLGATLWISWPKKTSPGFVDLTEGGVREALLPTGWVDVKVCAVDADWSALKFLRRRS
jgi:hypothetical protein